MTSSRTAINTFALFVRFEGTEVFSLTQGWVFKGIYTDELLLNRAVDAIKADLMRRDEGMRATEYKVVEL